MRIIVTGGAGFIGSNLTLELERTQSGDSITVVDDFSCADFANLAGFGGDIIAKPCQELDFERYFGEEEVSCIYHLASITDTTVKDQRRMIECNVEGFRRVLDFAMPRGIKVVYASSAAVYGQTDGVMREDQRPAPVNAYGFSKMILDNLARAAAQKVTVLGLRYFNVYGPHEAHKGKMASMAYQLYQQMKSGQRPKVFMAGGQRRDFVYVKDAVAGTLAAGHCATSGVYNIGSGTALSFNELIALLNNSLGTALEPEYMENPYEAFYQNHTEASLAKSRKELGYEPQWQPAEGIADYIAWLVSTGGQSSASSSPR
ncbi:ADP-glyceromanno-heptose 6-epimerase [bacterium]|nr:ADP-glyceromanno-heptose 6-epimerase [bacterium]